MASDIFNYQVHDNIALITIDSPPVNALGIDVRKAIVSGFEKANTDPNVKAIVLTCAGRTFHAGADIKEFGKPPIEPTLRDVIAFIESIDKLSVAAVHGTALGGGLELAMGCHKRIALDSSRIVLPEVNLGILPGAGGTQKLPKIVGADKALDIILSGNMLAAGQAHELGILDKLISGDNLVKGALAYAEELVASGQSFTRVKDQTQWLEKDKTNLELFDKYRQQIARKQRGFKAPQSIIQSVLNSVTLPYDEGLALERELLEELLEGSQSAAQRRTFFAERETSKVPDIPKDTSVRPIEQVAVIGAGTMGGGIAMNFLNAGIPVTLMEREQAALDRGIEVITKNYQRSLKRGKLTEEQISDRLALIKPTLSMQDLSEADLIIEAVFEEMSIKKSVFTEIDKIAKPKAILASNTSYLDLDEIAAVTTRPEDVIGMHFFSPANVMPLLEVVRAETSSLDAIHTAMKLAKTINKVPVLSRVCTGFIANRVMTVRAAQARNLMLEGISPERIDQVVYDYGFAMGPFAMRDLVGLDVVGRNDNTKTVESELVKLGRLGQKQNGGFYDYDEKRNRTLSPIALKVIAELAEEKQIKQIDVSNEEILARLLYPIVNEGAKVLDEGIAIRSSDIDIACIKGYNWPVYHGGPMQWANSIGLEKVLEGLTELESRYGDDFKPSPYLIKLVEGNQSF